MRVKTGTVRHKRHKKILKMAKGYTMGNSTRIKEATQAVLHAGEYAFHGRKLRKRDFRRLWISRINAALSKFDLSYSKFIDRLKKSNILLNRKILAELAINNPEIFAKIVKKVK